MAHDDEARRRKALGLPDLTGATVQARGNLYQQALEAARNDPFSAAVVPPGASAKEKLLIAATALFERKGVEAVELHDVALLAGVNQGQVMMHFLGKEELLMQVLRREVDAFVNVASTWPSPKMGGGDLIWFVADRSLSYFSSHMLLLQLLLGVLLEHLPTDQHGLLRQRLNTGFAEALKMGIRTGAFRPDLPVDMVASLLLDLHAGGYLFIEAGPDRVARIQQRRTTALDIVLNGIYRR